MESCILEKSSLVDKSFFLLKNSCEEATKCNIQKTIPFDSGSMMVWGCILHDCKLDWGTVQGNLNGPSYQDILETVIILTLTTIPSEDIGGLELHIIAPLHQ